MSTKDANPKIIQPELLLPGESPLSGAGEITPKDRADIVAEALQKCPAMAALPEDRRRWAVVQALSDRQKLGVVGMAKLAGVGERTAYRCLVDGNVQAAVAEVVRTLTPAGFAALRAVGAELAGRLAEDLRYGRRTVGDLAAGERYLLDLAHGAGGSGGQTSRTVVTLGQGGGDGRRGGGG